MGELTHKPARLVGNTRNIKIYITVRFARSMVNAVRCVPSPLGRRKARWLARGENCIAWVVRGGY